MTLKMRMIWLGLFISIGAALCFYGSDLPPIFSHYLSLLFLGFFILEALRDFRAMTVSAPPPLENNKELLDKMDKILESLATTQQAISFIIERAGLNKPKTAP